MFGVSSAAYQVEGAWNLDGKGPSIWDDFTHNHPEKIVDHQNADVGPNSYEFYEDDIEAIKSIDVSHSFTYKHNSFTYIFIAFEGNSFFHIS